MPKTHYYTEYNEALDSLYSTNDKDQEASLVEQKELFRFDLNTVEKAIKALHKEGQFVPEILANKEGKALIKENYRILAQAIETGVQNYNTNPQEISGSIKTEVPQELTAALQDNAFVFSGWKTYHTLNEAGIHLRGENGGIKPFAQFEKEAQEVFKKQGLNLQAEYRYAVQTAQMAAKWNDIKADGDRYDLQYRTAGDNRVRESHASLNNTTLPPSDSFWSSYYPPNGWGCRCTAVQVRKGKYEHSDSATAIANGNASTAEPRQKIFRQNAGERKKIFPEKHPNYPKNCESCPNKNNINLFTPRDQSLLLCQSCKYIQKECLKNQEKEIRTWAKQKIDERKGLSVEGKAFKSGSILFTRNSIRETINHSQNMAVRHSLYNIEKSAESYKYIGWGECHRDKKTGKTKHLEAEYFLYYKLTIGGKIYYANVKAQLNLGREVLYCIREKCSTETLQKGEPPHIDHYKMK